jgi:hypothetical protein
MSGLQQQASSGAIPPLTLSKIMQLVSNDKMELAEALNKVTEDALKEQKAQQEAAMGPDAGGPTSPDMAAAGATVGAMAGAQPPSPIPGVGPGMASLGDMLGSLRRPAMTVQPMRGVDRGAV